IRGFDRVTQLPQPKERTQEIHTERDDASVRAAAVARVIREGNLNDAPPGRVRLDEDLFQHLEVRPIQRECLNGRSAVEPKPAREIANRQSETTREKDVQNV